MNEAINKEILSLSPSTLITLYEIVLKHPHEGNSYRFHAGENGFDQAIKYGGTGGQFEYYPLSMEASGFDFEDETLPRPKLSFDNTGGFFGLKTRFFKDFIGFELKRTRTFIKFLHGSNFPNNINPFGSATEDSFPVETYLINQKTVENANTVEFELISPLEKEGAFLPNRKVLYNICQWKYRDGHGCGYAGAPKTDGNNNDFPDGLSNKGKWVAETNYSTNDYVYLENTNEPSKKTKYFVALKNNFNVKPGSNNSIWAEDVCVKSINGCRKRFGSTEQNNGLPFGGFPGAWPG